MDEGKLLTNYSERPIEEMLAHISQELAFGVHIMPTDFRLINTDRGVELSLIIQGDDPRLDALSDATAINPGMTSDPLYVFELRYTPNVPGNVRRMINGICDFVIWQPCEVYLQYILADMISQDMPLARP
jgi:hypothetical protein